MGLRSTLEWFIWLTHFPLSQTVKVPLKIFWNYMLQSLREHPPSFLFWRKWSLSLLIKSFVVNIELFSTGGFTSVVNFSFSYELLWYFCLLVLCKQFIDKDQQPSGSERGDDDVEAALKKEVGDMKASTEMRLRRFQSMESGANNVVFIRTLGIGVSE